MDQDSTPVLDAIEQIRREGTYTFSLPGHRFGRGVDDRTAEVLSRDTFAADVIMAKSSVSDAEELYADAAGAKHAVFTTCGSSISIHTAVLTVTRPGRKVLVDRNVHKSVVASLILGGADPVWLRPCWDHQREIAHPASTEAVAEALRRHPGIASVILITPTEYGTGADVRAVAELCHERGLPLFAERRLGERALRHFDQTLEILARRGDSGGDLGTHVADTDQRLIGEFRQRPHLGPGRQRWPPTERFGRGTGRPD